MIEDDLIILTDKDIIFVERILPKHYAINRTIAGHITCVSKIGIRKGIDSEDNEHWHYIFSAIKNHFKGRFREVYHNVCFCHTNFTIFIKRPEETIV